MKTEELIRKIAANPKSLDVLTKALDDPKRAIETLDFLIRSPSTSEDSRKRYQGVRDAMEAYVAETKKD